MTSVINGTLGSNNWYNAATLTASASDPLPGSGLLALDYNLDNSGWTVFPASGGLDLLEGQHNVEIRAVDNAGRIVSATKSYSLDGTLPTIALSPAGTLGLNNWYTTSLTLTASPSDNTSGMDIFEYSLNNGAWTTYSAPLILNDGTHKVSFWAQDKAGLVKQLEETYQVDTRAPKISGSLSGVPGANGWYISQVTISASAADPVPGSGLEALTYILNGGAQTAYANPITLSDGEHTIQFSAQDFAGLADTMQQIVKVDTLPPSLKIETALPAWNKDTVTLKGMAGDGGSGTSKVEISIDGGSTWRPVSGTTSWNYDWDTTTGGSGTYQLRVRVTDNAGLTTVQDLKTGVDNSPPKISLPSSWLQWDTVTLDVWDNDSGVSEVRVEISDPEGRWKTRKIDLDPNAFPLNFKWDRRFGDDTVAPLGTYPVKVIAYDKMGNMKRVDATIKILLGILPAGPVATAQPYLRVDSTPTPAFTPTPFATPTATSTPVTSGFGSTPEPIDQAQNQTAAQTESNPTTIATPRAVPTQTTVMDWLESIFVPNTTEETVTDVSTPETDSKVHWDATLAAMMAAVTAYTLAEKRKREEEERPRGDHAHKRYLEKEKAKRNHEALMHDIAKFNEEQQKEAAKQKGQNLRAADKESALDAEMKSYSAKPQDWKPAYDAYMEKKAEDAVELQAGMAAYYSAMRQGEKEAQTVTSKEKPWWEKTLNWIDDHQVEIALGVGIVVGIGALVISGGTAAPLVAATWTATAAWMAGAAAVAGGTVVLGTVGLNAYYGRPLMENVARNLAIAGATAAVVTGGGFLLKNLAPLATTVIGGVCTNYQTACNQVGTVIDLGEEALLFAQSGYYNFVGDQENAAQTAIEIQLEHMDGGVPGNSLALEAGEQLAKLGPDAAELIARYGDDAIDIIGRYRDDGVELLTNHGDEVIDLLKMGSPAHENWTDYVPEEFHGHIISGFDGEPVAITLNESVSVYRYWSNIDGDRGRWVTLDPNLSPEDARSLLALPDENYASNVTQFVIPEGTTILVGKAAEQTTADWAGAYAIGGGFQIFIPDKNILTDTPLLNP